MGESEIYERKHTFFFPPENSQASPARLYVKDSIKLMDQVARGLVK